MFVVGGLEAKLISRGLASWLPVSFHGGICGTMVYSG